MTTTDVIARAQALACAYDLAFADCFAEDGVLELPFAPACLPRRAEGRAAIRALLEPAYRAAREAGRRILGLRDERLHATSDPEVAICEFTLEGQDAAGAIYRLPFVHVFRVRGGQIALLRDYFDSAALAGRLGTSAPAPAPASAPAAPRRPAAPTPREVLGKLLAGITEGRWEELPALYAEHAQVSLPQDYPPRRLEGRAAIAAHFQRGKRLPLALAARDVVVHETADPEVIVAEYEYLGRATTTGRSFQLPVVLVMRVRDGQIVQSRDYGNRLVVAHALGAASELLAQLDGAPPAAG
jgi:ketosteroid isomerase-like protein